MAPLKPVPDAPAKGNAFGKLAIGEENVTTVAREKAETEVREPQMAALRRIFGDTVLDIFPPELRDAVDKCYQFWMTHPDSYINTLFDTPEELRDSLIAMRAYGECADNGGYTIRTLTKPDPCLLTWRTQNRRERKAKNAPTDATASGTPAEAATPDQVAG